MAENELKERIIQALEQVIDPEVGVNVWEMRLVRNLKVDGGEVHLTFTPTSPICPLAFRLGIDIKKAVEGVDGVDKLTVDVEGFIDNDRLRSAIENA